ncbi:MAG TPA: hypothetical protein VIM61_10820 [Chthoniobacterales bacterium]|jgi:hypothetical protein
MTTPDIFRDDESGDMDVFVPPALTGALIEFLRGKVPFFGVTIESAFDDEEEVDTREEGDEEDTEPVDAFSFPSEVDEDELAALLDEFFSAR